MLLELIVGEGKAEAGGSSGRAEEQRAEGRDPGGKEQREPRTGLATRGTWRNDTTGLESSRRAPLFLALAKASGRRKLTRGRVRPERGERFPRVLGERGYG